jgi:heterodisulfide reductase subunit A
LTQPVVLIVGGGVAGIEAALGASMLGAKVYLVESKPSLGGRVAQLSSLYPQLKPAGEALSPRVEALLKDPSVEVLTYAELASAARADGGFKVRVARKARHVDASKCDACGRCSEACPAAVPDEFNLGLSKRKAVYLPPKWAVPAAYLVDEASCPYFKDRSCRLCVEACPKGAISLDEAPSYVELKVGAIVVATGFDPFDLRLKPEYGFSASPDVISGLHLERMLSPDGPTGGEVVAPSKGARPRSIAIVLCAGSRDRTALPYCCRVGCMAGLKHAYELKRRYGDEVNVHLCFNDVRAAGKGYEEFYREVRRAGAIMVRGLPSEVRPVEDGLAVKLFDEATEKLMKLSADLVVLEAGLVLSEGGVKAAEVLGLERGGDGFLAEADPKLDTWSTKVPGVFMAGACHAPKDVAEAVSQAKAAALAAVAYAKRSSIG